MVESCKSETVTICKPFTLLVETDGSRHVTRLTTTNYLDIYIGCAYKLFTATVHFNIATTVSLFSYTNDYSGAK
jgi:hypothetical protein